VRTVLPGLLTCLFVIACGDDSTPLTADDPAAFVEGMAVAHCRHQTRCGRFQSTEGCLAKLDFGESERAWRALQLYDSRWPGAVSRGAVSFVREEANACLAALENGHCDQAADATIDTSACARALRPTVPPGQPSRYPFECASGAWAEDAPYCNAATSCCAVACAEPPPPPGEIGASCVEVPCRPGLVCDAGTCAAGREPGAACRDFYDCPDLHECLNGACRPIEDACVPEFDYFFCRHFGEVCGIGGCGPRGGVGEACGSGARACRDDLACDEGRRCVVPPVEILAAGQRCELGERCADGLYCGSGDDTFRTCRPQLADGATCFAAYQCTSGHCRGDVCASPLTCP
jgi:hypothetical protein